MLAKSKVEGFQLASHSLHSFGQRGFAARSFVLFQPLDSFSAICRLKQATLWIVET